MEPTGQVPDTAVVIPARHEARLIAQTVHGALNIAGVDVVLVVDDGSRDRTGEVAEQAGAIVVRQPRSQGKAAAMALGATVLSGIETQAWRAVPRHLLFLDADLGDSAAGAAHLVEPVRRGLADMTIGVLPPQAGGGRGRVVLLAGAGIRRLSGFETARPLSGQRCLTRAAFDAARPLAHGFGVETGLTIDLLRRGYRVLEVPVRLHHRVTGRDIRSRAHRGVQFVDVARALAVRCLRGRSGDAWPDRLRLGITETLRPRPR
jgi:glycosyltransferase involved in cell wall biosynthesis